MTDSLGCLNVITKDAAKTRRRQEMGQKAGDKCGRMVHYRGLCVSCYMILWRQIRRGETTWEELMGEGRAGPRAKRRKPGDPDWQPGYKPPDKRAEFLRLEEAILDDDDDDLEELIGDYPEDSMDEDPKPFLHE